LVKNSEAARASDALDSGPVFVVSIGGDRLVSLVFELDFDCLAVWNDLRLLFFFLFFLPSSFNRSEANDESFILLLLSSMDRSVTNKSNSVLADTGFVVGRTYITVNSCSPVIRLKKRPGGFILFLFLFFSFYHAVLDWELMMRLEEYCDLLLL
jgi:hypothetical protein